MFSMLIFHLTIVVDIILEDVFFAIFFAPEIAFV
jgi:hypothetical protein